FSMCYRCCLARVPDITEKPFPTYSGVWHLNEPEDGIQVVKGSSRNGLTGLTHARSLAVKDGKVGGARRVGRRSGPSASWGNIVVEDPENRLHNGSSAFTVSFWMKWCTNTADYAYLVSHKGDDGTAGWGIQYSGMELSSSTTLRVWTRESSQSQPNNSANVSGFPADDQTWHHVAFVYGEPNTAPRSSRTMAS
ncbi:MAG: LamG-like jellyroll fold domain-containing protein, partial [Kiritimatiellia bacterium]